MISLAAGTNSDGRIDLYGMNRDGKVSLRYQTYPGGSWTDWNPMPDLAVSSASVPNLYHQNINQATDTLWAANLRRGKIDTIDVSEKLEAGWVRIQSPGPWSQVPLMSAVDITVGKWDGGHP
jgi:hypothetical protein